MMSNRQEAINVLHEKGSVVISCNGGSMKPLIHPKEAIHLIKVDPVLLRVGDAVFVRVSGGLQVHKIDAIDKDRYKITNWSGWGNSWVPSKNIYGLCVQVEDRVVVSADEMEKRKAENGPS
jgi:hypothetical protein